VSSTSRSVLAKRDFRLLWVGEAVSALGDQFALVALPWLALLLTGSALALGTVLAVMAIPRALFMLVGGAFVDRLSPRRVMLVSNAVRLVAVSVLGLIVLAGAAQLWMLYVFAIVFGIADAFFYPAQTAIVPELVEGEQLQQANGITQGTTQLTVLIGPALAGLVIAGLAAMDATPDLAGIGLVLLIDGATFLVSLVTLMFINARHTSSGDQGSVLGQIGEGVRFALAAPALRVVMVLSMGLNLLLVGPIEVGLPALAYARLPEGAAAFGLILSAFGGGSLVGLLAADVAPTASAGTNGIDPAPPHRGQRTRRGEPRPCSNHSRSGRHIGADRRDTWLHEHIVPDLDPAAHTGPLDGSRHEHAHVLVRGARADRDRHRRRRRAGQP
jgi:MFS family permease